MEPRDIREEERLLQQKILDAEANKSKLQIISRNAASTIVNPGSVSAANWGGSFVVSLVVFICVKIQAILTNLLEKCCSYSQAKEGRGFQGRPYPREPASGSYFRVFPPVSILVYEGTSTKASAARPVLAASA